MRQAVIWSERRRRRSGRHSSLEGRRLGNTSGTHRRRRQDAAVSAARRHRRVPLRVQQCNDDSRNDDKRHDGHLRRHAHRLTWAAAAPRQHARRVPLHERRGGRPRHFTSPARRCTVTLQRGLRLCRCGRRRCGAVSCRRQWSCPRPRHRLRHRQLPHVGRRHLNARRRPWRPLGPRRRRTR